MLVSAARRLGLVRRDAGRRLVMTAAAALVCARGAAAVPPALLLRQGRAGAGPPLRRSRALLGPVARLPGDRRPSCTTPCGAIGLRRGDAALSGLRRAGAERRRAGRRRHLAGASHAGDGHPGRRRGRRSRSARRCRGTAGSTTMCTLLQGIRARRPLRLAVAAGAGGAGRRRAGRLERRWPARATPLDRGRGRLVTAEAARTPMAFTRFAGHSRDLRVTWRRCRAAVLAEFPFPDPRRRFRTTAPTFWPRRRISAPMLNGYSGFTPASYHLHAAVAAALPVGRRPCGSSAISASTHLVDAWRPFGR